MTQLSLKSNSSIECLKLLGDFWTLRIIDVLSGGPRRFTDLHRLATGVTTVTLTRRLKVLEVNQLITRTEVSRADVRYALTTLGQKAIPMIEAVAYYSRSAELMQAQATRLDQ